MSKFLVRGGKQLNGTIEIKGSKNEAYQVICASLLTSETVILKNIPDILDIKKIFHLLKLLGVTVEKISEATYQISAKKILKDALTNPDFIEYASSIRGTVMLIAPLLVRLGYAKIPKPGGDKIGRRPLDTHLKAFSKMGAKINFSNLNNFYSIEAKKLTGTYILLDEASVTGTANIIMAAVLAEGTTTIFNAASEPYIGQLCKMLLNMGANINGGGSNLIQIVGVKFLKGTTHEVMPDIMEVGSFIGLAVTTMSDIKIKKVPVNSILPIVNNFQKLGIKIKILENEIHVPIQKHYKINNQIDGSIQSISDNIWPGFPSDLISIIIVAAIQSKGTLLIRQRMFESRLFFVDNLIEMGAEIILCDPHRAVVIGLDRKSNLRPTNIKSPDIRAGLALMIAALSADGTSIIDNASQIDRGYENIEIRLKKLGADIERIE